MYNDKAVLESHHCASAFQVLNQAQNNFIAHLNKAEFKAIREIVIDLVLATGNFCSCRFDAAFYSFIHVQNKSWIY